MKKKVKSCFRVFTVVLFIGLGGLSANAQNQLEVSVGSDVVSNYIWRGQDCGGASIQPSLSIGKGGLSLSAWGSVGFSKEDTKEFDLTLGYSTGGFSVAVTDYWFDYEKSTKYFTYNAHKTAHIFELTAGYDFGLLAFNWNTYFAGDDYTKANGKRAYSSYAEISAPFKLGEVNFVAEAGLTPWEGAYSTGFNVVNIGLMASKEIKITDSFNVPVFAKVVVNPNAEKTYFVFGMTF